MSLVTSSCEVWGDHCRMDSLAYYFSSLFLKSRLVDVEPSPFVPTLRNGRCGEASIEKCMDHFLVVESLLRSFEKYKSWVGPKLICDHQPIFLQVDGKED